MADGENDPSPMSSTIPARVDLRASDTRKGRRLKYFTLGWNLTEALQSPFLRYLSYLQQQVRFSEFGLPWSLRRR